MDREQEYKDAEALLRKADEARSTARLPVSLETKVDLARLAEKFENLAAETIENIEAEK